jgi:hypothetical protein
MQVDMHVQMRGRWYEGALAGTWGRDRPTIVGDNCTDTQQISTDSCQAFVRSMAPSAHQQPAHQSG